MGPFAQDLEPIEITGEPGTVVVSSPYPLSVRSEPAGDDIRWHILTSSDPVIPGSLESWVMKNQAGFVVALPSSKNPALLWTADGLKFRWDAGGESPRPDSGRGSFESSEAPVYPLGPEDKIQLRVYNVEDMDKTFIVDPNGNITFPLLGDLRVSGMTATELQADLEERLGEYIRDPQIAVEVMEYSSRFVNVLGEVRQPGRVSVRGSLRILDAVTQAGGFSDKSGDIEIQRRDPSGKIRTRTLTQESLLTGDQDRYNFYLHDQDVVHVHLLKSVYVSGEVARPGSFPYDKELTLLRAVTLAGGFTQWAKRSRVDILREEADGTTKTIRVDAGDIEKGMAEDVALKPNDHVVVKERKLF